MSTWCECAQPEVGRKIKSLNTFFVCFGLCLLWSWPLVQLWNKETRSFEWLNNLRLSALTSHTHHQAAKSSPNWQPPDLRVWATLIDKNFEGVESSLEVKILVSNLPLYIIFVGEKKKSCHFGMNFFFDILDRKECFLDQKVEIFQRFFVKKWKFLCCVLFLANQARKLP